MAGCGGQQWTDQLSQGGGFGVLDRELFYGSAVLDLHVHQQRILLNCERY